MRSQTNTKDGALLAVSDLAISFGHADNCSEVVRGLSFDLYAGQTLGIVGESGSGKSVSSLAILGLARYIGATITNGHAKFDSDILGRTVDLLSLGDDQLLAIRGNEIAMIFQEPMTSLNPVFTIGSQITEMIRLHKGFTSLAAMDEAVRLLDMVRMPNARDVLGNYPHQLSGGMRQRVMIAMALSCQPKVLIADEPTTALDVTIQAQILSILRDLQAEFGTAVIFITHDMGVVADMADDVLVMRDGEKVDGGSVEKIFSDPTASYTRELLNAAPRIGSMTGKTAPEKFDVPGAVRTPSGSGNTPEGTPLVEVRDLSTYYDIRSGLLNRVTHRVYAAESVSFQIARGETLALVGESGSGKSTVGKTLQQLVKSASGQVLFEGQDILRADAAQAQRFRQQIQYIFQDPYGSLNPRKRVGNSISEPITTHRILTDAKAVEHRVHELLEHVGLTSSMAARFPHEFSGGQRQRICIARALACNPSLIIADEAVSALDVSVQAHIVNLLMDLQAEHGLSYLFITHDMAVVERISHRVAVMYMGQLVELGTRQQIFETPQHSYTRRLLSAVPVPDPGHVPIYIPMTGDIPSVIHEIGNPPKRVPMTETVNGHLVADDAVFRSHIEQSTI